MRALVTGGSSGIGKALVRCLRLRESAEVTDVSRRSGIDLVDFINPYGPQQNFSKVNIPIQPIQGGVASNPFHLVVCNAAEYSYQPNLASLNMRRLAREMEVNFLGHVGLVRFLLMHSLVTINTVVYLVLSCDLLTHPDDSIGYVCSKAALSEFAYCLAKTKRVKVGGLLLGATDTPMLHQNYKDIPGVLTPQQVAEYIVDTAHLVQRQRCMDLPHMFTLKAA